MAAEVIRTELKASGDRRIRAGLRGAIEHLAGRHGMSAAEQREFANEVDAECSKIAAQNEAGPCCDVLIEEQDDQIKVKIRPLERRLKNLSAASSPKHEEARSLDDGRSTATLVRHFHKSVTRS